MNMNRGVVACKNRHFANAIRLRGMASNFGDIALTCTHSKKILTPLHKNGINLFDSIVRILLIVFCKIAQSNNSHCKKVVLFI